MVASTTSRPSAAPAMEQRLDHLQAPTEGDRESPSAEETASQEHCVRVRKAGNRAMKRQETVTVSPEYGALLKRVAPKVIRTEKENEAYTEILYELDQRSKRLTAAEKELAELLTLLIEDFEEKRYRLPRAKPLEVVRYLMEEHNLLQKDLADVFGTRSIVSEVLSGKRELNKDQIARLSARFHVSPEVFF
jgi:HTH-type transcriptional regulator/antitoxin HigA